MRSVLYDDLVENLVIAVYKNKKISPWQTLTKLHYDGIRTGGRVPVTFERG